MAKYKKISESNHTIQIYADKTESNSQKSDRKAELFLEISVLKRTLKVKQDELLSICDHKHFNGQSAYSEYGEVKECGICGDKRWI